VTTLHELTIPETVEIGPVLSEKKHVSEVTGLAVCYSCINSPSEEAAPRILPSAFNEVTDCSSSLKVVAAAGSQLLEAHPDAPR